MRCRLDARIARRLRLPLVTARQPDAAELSRLIALFTTELTHYRAHPDDARAVTTAAAKRRTHTGDTDSSAGIRSPAPSPSAGHAPSTLAPASDAAEQAAWTIVANVLFNLDETVTKE